MFSCREEGGKGGGGEGGGEWGEVGGGLNDAEVFPKIFKMEGVSVVEGGKTKIILWNLGILALKLGEALKLIIGGGA